jgi:hypothetical protein
MFQRSGFCSLCFGSVPVRFAAAVRVLAALAVVFFALFLAVAFVPLVVIVVM